MSDGATVVQCINKSKSLTPIIDTVRDPWKLNAQAKSEQGGESSASGARLSFGAVDPSRSAE